MIEIIIIIVSTICDALRDKHFGEWDWLKWHIVKWLDFYPPLAYVLFKSNMNLFYQLIVTIFSYLIWKYVYEK